MNRAMRILVNAVMLALAPLAMAQTSTTTTTTSTNAGQTQVGNNLASNFTNLAGGEANARALVSALRSGTPATLTTTTTPAGSTTPVTTTTSIDVPTKPMGWGNVKIALALAQKTLLAAGITQPTPAQLQAALNGGDVTVTTGTGATATTTTTHLNGVLVQRASGMGWGQVAQANGTKLGPVVSSYKATNAQLTSQNAGTTTTTTTAAGTTTTGITTAAGAGAGNVQGAKGLTTASGGGASSGVVTGAGGGSGNGNGNGNAYGRGVVTASGAAAGTTVTTAQGHGNGNAGGNGKGNGKGGG